MESEYLTVAQVAAMFDCHPETIKRMARSGELPAFKFGRKWFFPKSQFMRHLVGKIQSACHLRRDKEKK